MRTCKIEGCENNAIAKGYCNKHYLMLWRYGDPAHTAGHGMTHTPEYRTWQSMKRRCYNKKNNRYEYYGGRGITVCDRWKNSFIAFFRDMGLKPFPKATIDRIDNDGNYEPGNCHWTTCVENNRHTSRTKLTIQKAKEIRKHYAKGNVTQMALGCLYRIHQNSISRIINNKTWVT